MVVDHAHHLRVGVSNSGKLLAFCSSLDLWSVQSLKTCLFSGCSFAKKKKISDMKSKVGPHFLSIGRVRVRLSRCELIICIRLHYITLQDKEATHTFHGVKHYNGVGWWYKSLWNSYTALPKYWNPFHILLCSSGTERLNLDYMLWVYSPWYRIVCVLLLWNHNICSEQRRFPQKSCN